MKAFKIVVDADCMRKIWESAGISRNKIEVIPFGVDTNLFNPNTKGSRIREELGIRKDAVVIVSTRPFIDHYNIECLIKAISIIVKEHEDVFFMIKGEGPLRSDLIRLTKKLGVERYVRFSKPVPYHKMPQYLTAADIYVSPSFIDSTSVSLLEAMACGLPPITTDIPGNKEWVKDGVNGFLYPPKDHEALSERIMRLIENEDLRKRFGERCIREVEKRATWDECVSKMETIYQSTI
jgi:glycosyltransferase involved in cell wall biosynthesis